MVSFMNVCVCVLTFAIYLLKWKFHILVNSCFLNELSQVQGWVKSGLRDFSISRASVDWGIPVPSDVKQTIYVWFDALLG